MGSFLIDIAYVAKLRQPLVPIPNFVSECWLVAHFVIQANFNNAVDIAQALRQLVVRMVMQTPLESTNDLLARKAGAAWASHSQDERKTEFDVVVSVELLDMRELFWCAIRQASFALFVGGFCGQAFTHHGLAGQFWVGAYQCNLGVSACALKHLHHRIFESCR